MKPNNYWCVDTCQPQTLVLKSRYAFIDCSKDFFGQDVNNVAMPTNSPTTQESIKGKESIQFAAVKDWELELKWAPLSRLPIFACRLSV